MGLLISEWKEAGRVKQWLPPSGRSVFGAAAAAAAVVAVERAACPRLRANCHWRRRRSERQISIHRWPATQPIANGVRFSFPRSPFGGCFSGGGDGATVLPARWRRESFSHGRWPAPPATRPTRPSAGPAQALGRRARGQPTRPPEGVAARRSQPEGTRDWPSRAPECTRRRQLVRTQPQPVGCLRALAPSAPLLLLLRPLARGGRQRTGTRAPWLVRAGGGACAEQLLHESQSSCAPAASQSGSVRAALAPPT